ncbi:MAG: polyprenyl synthetase family protein, partial [Muribaculaceae bacterium]|nr:polyprenyl synthetase family protein [Muribaculaceae bacterium]
CYIGALTGGADTSAARAFYEYGVNLGLAFQLRDDWLDTYGDPAVFGKKIGGDIVNRKKTWLLISALRDRREELSDILAEDLEEDELIRQVKAVYDSLRLSEKCDILITEYARKAVAALDNAGISDEDRTYFAELAMKLSSRNK